MSSVPDNSSADGVPKLDHYRTVTNDYGDSGSHGINRTDTAGSISISPELFEKLYLAPKTNVHGDLRRILGNPTPLAIMGFCMCLTPLSCDLMGWRGAGGDGAAGIAGYIFFGGLLQTVGGFLEFILGNTFPFVVFMSFGAFYFTIALNLVPFYNSYGFYSPQPTTDPAAGLSTTGWNASYAYFFVFFGILCIFYLICSLRTNIVFVWIFFTVAIGAEIVGAGFFAIASKDTGRAGNLFIAGGAMLFACSMGGWYLLLALLLPSVDFPFNLPVGDLSHLITGASERASADASKVDIERGQTNGHEKV